MTHHPLQRFRLTVADVTWEGLYRGSAIRSDPASAVTTHRLASPPPEPGGERGLDLLLLHGTAGSSHCWSPVCEHLDPARSVLIPDLPGHGQTVCHRHARHGIDDMAEDLNALLQALGYTRVRLVAGHSAGAAIAIALALGPATTTAPAALSVESILGIAPSLVPPPSLYTLMLGPILAPWVSSRVSIAAAALLARNTAVVDRLLDSTASTIDPAQREVYRRLLASTEHLRGAIDFMAATDLPRLLERLPNLRANAQFLIAEDDPWIPADRLRAVLQARLPQARLEFCRGGHLLPESMSRGVAECITAMSATPPPH